jgi:autotransporter-associated beta strand protein
VGSVGSFTNAANWDTGWVPTNGVAASVDNGGTAQFDGGTALVDKLGLGSSSGTSGTFEMTAGVLSNTYFCVGMGTSATGRVTQSGGSLIQQGVTGWADPSVGIGYGSNTVGSYTLSKGALTVNVGTFHVGSQGNGTLLQTGGAVTGFSWMVVARYLGSRGQYTLAGGILGQMSSAGGVVVGEQGYGVLTVTNGGYADLVGSLAISGGSASGASQGTGIVNLCSGGTICTPIVKKNLGASATFNFDGGLLRARGDGATIANFMQGLTTVNVKPGGANIDTGNNAITIAQNLSDAGGGLVKTGNGVLTLSGSNTYAGATIISNGFLSATSPSALPGYNQDGRVSVCSGAGLAVGTSGGWSDADTYALGNHAAFADGTYFGFDTTAGSVTLGTALNFPMGLLKVGVNTLKLTGSNSYTGATRVVKGVLQADFGVGLPAATNVTLAGGTLSTASGTLTPSLGAGAGQINIVSNQPAGFSAYGVPLTVSLGGAAAELVWGSDAFSPTPLLLNEVGADSALAFANGLDLMGRVREIDVNATASGAAATVTGKIADSVGGAGLTKAGNGVLTLAGTNVFSGAATVSAGLLTLTSPSNVMGSVTVSTGGRLTVDGAVVRVPYFGLTVGGSGAGSLNVYNGGIYCASNVYVGLNSGSTGTVSLTNGTLTCGTLRVGYSGTGVVVQTGGTLGRVSGGDWIIGVASSGVGTYTLSGGTLDTGSANFQLGYNGRGTLLQTGGTLNSGSWPVVGRYLGGVGVYTLSGGVFNQTGTGNGLVVGEQGLGTFTLNGSGVANLYGALYLSGGGSGNQGTGIVNLCTGGTLNTPVIKKNSGFSATFNFDGGTLRARANSVPITNYMQGLTAAYVKTGGAVIDSSNDTITVAQNLASGAASDGGLTKLGLGALILTGTNTYNGATTVSNGILRMGSVASAPVGGAVTVAGGTYDLGGYTATSGVVTLRSGSIINGTLAASAYELFDGSVSATLDGGGSLTKQGGGAVMISGAGRYAGDTVVEGGVLRIGKGPVHRWSFNGSLADSAGGSDATAIGSVTAGATQYTLTGGTRGTSYLSLGNNILPTTTPITIEIWATQNSVQNWSRILDFGANMANFILMSWTQGTTLGSDRVEVQQNGVSTKVDSSMQPYSLGTEYHIAMVITPNGGGDGKALFQWYKMDASGTALKSVSMCTNYSFSALVQTNMWLGHSEYNDYDASASYNEVRIWDAALSQAQLASNSVAGADVLLPMVESDVLSSEARVTVASGAALDLGGSSQTIAGLSGGGMVSNGTLTVTGTVAPGGTNVIGTLTLAASTALTGTLLMDVAADGSSDLLNVQGALDLTALTLRIQDAGLLKTRTQYLIATCTPGGLKGPFEATDLDGNRWSVSYNNAKGEVRLVSRGLLVLVR